MASHQNIIQNNSLSLVNLGIIQSQGLEITLSNLSNIDQSINNILSRFQNKYNQYKVNIQDYLQRINNCQKKILALQQQKKAITFVSPSQLCQKYKPSQNNKQSLTQDYKQRPDFSYTLNTFNQLFKTELEYQGPFINDEAFDFDEELALQTHKLKNRAKNLLAHCSATLDDNDAPLGTYPKRIKCAESLLVLNTKTNPFRKNQQKDNLLIINKNRQRLKRQRDQSPINSLQAAPLGIKDQIQIYQISDLIYKPDKRQILNEVAIPQNLDLEGIADFENEDNCQSQMQLSKSCLIQNPQISDPYENLQPNIDLSIKNLQNNQSQQIINEEVNQIQNIYQEDQLENSNDHQKSQLNIQQLPFMRNSLENIRDMALMNQNKIIQQEDTYLLSQQQIYIASENENQQQVEVQCNDQHSFQKEIQQYKFNLKPTITNERGRINCGSIQQLIVKTQEDQIDIKSIMNIRRLERQPPSKQGKGPKNRVGYFSDSSEDTDQDN